MLITMDKSLYNQQNLNKFVITVVVLDVVSNKYEDIQAILPKLYDILVDKPDEKLLIITP